MYSKTCSIKSTIFGLEILNYLAFRCSAEHPKSEDWLKYNLSKLQKPPFQSIIEWYTLVGLYRYHFKAIVQSYKGEGRFVMGFLEDVQVLGSKGFLQYEQCIMQKNT
jgi:hypothetical protein